MTDLETPETEEGPATEPSARNRKLLIAAAVAFVGVVIVGFLGYWFLFRDDSAAGVDTTEASEARQEALAEAETETETQPAVEAVEDDAVISDGVFTINTDIGTFDDACLTEVCNATFVGFRIDEELARIGAKTVVGRSPGVSGNLELEGTTIVSTEIVIDMTQLITDSRNRTNAIRRQAIETNAFPQASFVLTEPIELGALPGPGEQVQVDAIGEFTIHGVTRTETIALTAEMTGDVIVVFGQLGPFLLADYGIEKPTAAVVLSVEDNAIMELQLFFSR